MAVHVQKDGSTGRLNVIERFDFSALRDFSDGRNVLLADPAITEIEVDLSQASYLDSTALGMLIQLRDAGNGRGKTVSLRAPSAMAMSVLKVASFTTLFEIRDGQ